MLPSSPRRRRGNSGHTPAPLSLSGSSAGDQLKFDELNDTSNLSSLIPPRTAIYHIPPPHSVTVHRTTPSHDSVTSHFLCFYQFVVTKKGHTPEHSIIKSLVSMGRICIFLYSFGTGRGVRSHRVRRKILCTVIHCYWGSCSAFY